MTGKSIDFTANCGKIETMREKISTSIRLTKEGKQIVDRLSKRLGIDKSSVLELAIRELAKKENVK